MSVSELPDKRVLVTGGAGFIGSNLVRRLLRDEHYVTVLDNMSIGLRRNLPDDPRVKLVTGDVRDYELVSSVVRGHTKVLHLAAQAFIPLSYELPLQVAETNALGSLNVFKACLSHGVSRLVHMSSSEVYGTAQRTPMDESHPLHPLSTYAVAKAAADMWAQTFYWEHKLPVVIIRPFNAYGPHESLPYFIPEVIRQAFKEDCIRVGSLEAKRDFTYVEDTVAGLLCALDAEGIEGEVINVGSGTTHPMDEVLQTILKVAEIDGKTVIRDESRMRPKDVSVLHSDPTKASKLLGWKPTVNFEDGLKKTIDWYRSDGGWAYEKHGWQWRF